MDERRFSSRSYLTVNCVLIQRGDGIRRAPCSMIERHSHMEEHGRKGTTDMRKLGRNRAGTQKLGRELVSTSVSAVVVKGTLDRLIGRVPELPTDALRRAATLVTRLPQSALAPALSIIAGKLAHDFALRCLLLLEHALPNPREEKGADGLELDPDDSEDQKVLYRLLCEWDRMPETVRIQSLEDFGRFANVTAGLQRLIESASHEGQRSWVFDAAPQYRVRLKRALVVAHLEDGSVDYRFVVDALPTHGRIATRHRTDSKPLVLRVEDGGVIESSAELRDQVPVG